MARFYQSTPQQFVSQFVPENLELQQNYFDNLQKKQDVYTQTIGGLNADWQHLPNDTPFANETNKSIQTKLSGLQGLNANDPMSKDKITSGIMDVRKDLSSFGAAGIQDKKAKEYLKEKEIIDKDREKNPFKAAYRMAQLEQNAQDPNMAIKQGSNGGYENTSIKVPEDFEYKDKNKELSDWLKDEQFDETTHGLGLSPEQGHEALYSFIHGNTKELKGQQIYNDLLKRVQSDPNLQKSIEAEAYYFHKDPTELLNSALQGISSAGSFKRTELDKTLHDDSIEAARAKDKIEHPQFTLGNESALVPGEKTDYKTVAKNIDGVKQQLASLPPVGSANDNYETQAARSQLTKQLKIQNNYLDAANHKYINAGEGRAQLKAEYNNSVNNKNFLDDKAPADGLASILNNPDVKKYIKNSDDYVKFMSGELKLPEDLMNQKFKETGTSLSGSGMMSSAYSSLTDFKNTHLSKAVSDYVEKNPISYSAEVLTGNENSTVGKVNKELTDRVEKNGTNYYTTDGTDLNTWKNKHIEEGDKVEVAAMDKDINGQFAQYMTVRDKDGKVKSEMPIYPKDGGREEQGYIGRKLLEENKSKADPLETENYNRGKRMLANSLYGEQINEQELKSYIPRLENNSAVGVNVPVSLDINGGKFEGKIKMKKEGNVVSYELLNQKGESLMKNNKPVNSIDDLKTSLLGLE